MVDINIPYPGQPPAADPPLSIGALVAGTIDLMMDASDLPQPRYITISDTQLVTMQFARERASATALISWMLHFGGLMSREPCFSDGVLYTGHLLRFGYCGVEVQAYAFVPA